MKKILALLSLLAAALLCAQSSPTAFPFNYSFSSSFDASNFVQGIGTVTGADVLDEDLTGGTVRFKLILGNGAVSGGVQGCPVSGLTSTMDQTTIGAAVEAYVRSKS